jgi:hypothetical protein
MRHPSELVPGITSSPLQIKSVANYHIDRQIQMGIACCNNCRAVSALHLHKESLNRVTLGFEKGVCHPPNQDLVSFNQQISYD